jgi:hypothetical protein
VEFVETPVFKRQIDSLLSDEERRGLLNELLISPTRGELIRKGGGLRKTRYGEQKRGKGKRSGIRVIYFYAEARDTIYLLLAYGKNEQDDLTTEQLKVLRELVKGHLR